MKTNYTLQVAVSLALLYSQLAIGADTRAAKVPTIAPAIVPSDTQCATAADAARVSALYATAPAPMTFAAAPQLKLTEASIASAISADKAIGTTGAGFAPIWDSLTQWDGALFLVLKAGAVFEISSKVSKGEPSTKSKFFNLGHEGALSGHLRPDLVSSIYALQLPAREGMSRGVMFYDAKGENILGVFAGGEGKEPTTAQLAQFEATWNLIKSMPRACAAGQAAAKP